MGRSAVARMILVIRLIEDNMEHFEVGECVLPGDMVFPGRVLQGAHCLRQFAGVAHSFGRRGFVLYSRSAKSSGALDVMLGQGKTGRSVLPWRYSGGEPTLDQVEDVLQVARGQGAEWIAGIGGGSALDCAKSVAGLLHAPGAVSDYHGGRSIDTVGVPFLAVPTTAGSGSEATMVAVLSDPENKFKRSIRHPSFVARAVFLDPCTLIGMPATQIAHSGMDALVQAVEAFCSGKRTRVTDSFARESLGLILQYLERFYADSLDRDAAHGMLVGSYLAGLALSGARLGVGHGLAHPVGMQSGLGHGLVCAMALPHILQFNRGADPVRFRELDAMFGGRVDQRVGELLCALHIPANTGLPYPLEAEAMIDEVLASGSTEANPRPVSREDAEMLLHTLYR
ncbi:MAG: iron-containing alcohol dehydrogenase family protein [Kiritimatiellia bacterium]